MSKFNILKLVGAATEIELDDIELYYKNIAKVLVASSTYYSNDFDTLWLLAIGGVSLVEGCLDEEAIDRADKLLESRNQCYTSKDPYDSFDSYIYGPKHFGRIAVCLELIGLKIKRLRAMQQVTNIPSTEDSVFDSWLDLYNYARLLCGVLVWAQLTPRERARRMKEKKNA